MQAGPAARLSVLLVEDNQADARLVREMLRDEGPSPIDVTHASRLHEALAYLASQDFSAVLLDLTLPDSDGIETFERARAEAPTAPIVVLTGIADEALAARAVRHGAQDYLVKGRVNGQSLCQSIHYAVERYAVTDRLQRSEARYRTLVEGSIQGILIHVDGVVRFANRAAADMFGTEPARLAGRAVASLVDPEDRPAFDRYVQARLDGDAGASHLELRATRIDGSRAWLDCVVTPIPWDGEAALLATLMDVTERRRAEAELRESEDRFRQLAENVREAFIIADVPSFAAVYVSGAWAEIWGRPLEDAYASPTTWTDAIHAEDRGVVAAAQETLRAGEPATSVFRLQRPDGSLRWVRARTFPVLDENGRVYRMAGLIEDITDLRRTEDQLRQAQKMEAIGRLAGGIAHDFNNLLSAVLALAELVLLDLGAEHPSSPDVRRIQQAGQSATSLTQQLLAFSRRQILQPQVLDANAVVRQLGPLLRRLIGEHITLLMHLEADLDAISADPSQLEQVVLNLCVNARDAMVGGGRLTIQTSNVELDETAVSRHPGVEPGHHVLLSFTDTGVGMDETTRQQLFEPFFTTKEIGQGTGLGLATVYGIVRQSRGFIYVYSEPGLGTTFKVYFPAVADQAPRAVPRRVDPPLVGGDETVLLVEDQPELRMVAGEILRRHGYTVLEATDGEDALRVAGEADRAIDLLLTDVVMPGLGGREVADALVAERPSLAVVFTSGYADDAMLREGILDGALHFIQKPFSASSLLRKLREVLDSVPG
jgi:PAS domain S-box-containing protein